MVNGWTVAAALLTLMPFGAAAFFPESFASAAERLPGWLRLIVPAGLALPYALVACPAGVFRWGWLAVYAVLPVAIGWVLASAKYEGKRVGWREIGILLLLGLAVDLRWFERAWPPHLAVFNKMMLLDAGIYGFMALRQLDGVGFDLRLRRADVWVGLRELAIYTPIAIVLGLGLGFLHRHAGVPWMRQLPPAFLFTFFLIAVPEELFFRGWMQNMLERRMGRYPALAVTAAVFGLAHFNKRAAHFNWRYVLLAALAGIFYGRAWRAERRVGASALTHACVDTIWSVWLR